MTRTDTDSIFRGLSVFKNQKSPYYHCRIFIGDNKHIVRSTKEKTKIKARKVAEELYLEMKTNKEIGVPKNRTFKYFANELVKQEKQLSKGETRSERFSRDTQQVIHRDEKELEDFGISESKLYGS